MAIISWSHLLAHILISRVALVANSIFSSILPCLQPTDELHHLQNCNTDLQKNLRSNKKFGRMPRRYYILFLYFWRNFCPESCFISNFHVMDDFWELIMTCYTEIGPDDWIWAEIDLNLIKDLRLVCIWSSVHWDWFELPEAERLSDHTSSSA